MASILLLNGPNLGLLGTREPEVYGAETLAAIVERTKQQASQMGHMLAAFQSDAEHELIGQIHAARETRDFILFNPGAFTHTSIALRDALLGVDIPFIELHLSNTAARESFRHHSFFSDVAVGTVAGFGTASYELALIGADRWLSRGGT